jgi:microcystin-dependent protein
MAIQESDYMDFGNGIIGDDTFDVWRKKTNRVKVELDSVNTTLTTKINTDVANLSSVYIPQSGSATSVSTALQFTNNITLANSSLVIGARTVSESAGKLSVDGGIASTTSLEANTVQANSNLSLGTKTYSVPSSPAINNAVLVTQTDGTLSWQNVSDIFTLSGGLNQTTTVFEEVMPVGSVIPLAGEPNDPNFLLCEGGTALKDTYPDLFDVIGYSYDTGLSGTQQFRLPDYRGRVLVGTQGTSVTFPSSFGAKGGTETLSTSNHTLTIDQIPAHRHWSPWVSDDTPLSSAQKTTAKASPLFGADASDVSLTNLIHLDINNIDATTNNSDYYMYTTYAGGEAGDASLTGLGDVTNAQYTGGSSSSGAAHSHNITASNRVQPYVTVKWYIKAKKNTKIDFKIDIANSGLKSTTFGGEPQTLISPVNETIALGVNPDNTSIALDNNFKVSIKSNPIVQGKVTVNNGEPTAATHLTTKNYVDSQLTSGISNPTYTGNQALPARTTIRAGYAIQHQMAHYDIYRKYIGNTDGSTPTFIDVLDIKMTPRDDNSCFKIDAMINFESNGFSENLVFRLYRKIGSGSFTQVGGSNDSDNPNSMKGMATAFYDDNEDSTMNNVKLQFIDAPTTTSEITYSVAFITNTSTIFTLNRVLSDNNSGSYEFGSSNMIITELAGI